MTASITDDHAQLERASDIWELLRRAEKLGYTLTLGPQQLRELIKLLEDAKLARPK